MSPSATEETACRVAAGVSTPSLGPIVFPNQVLRLGQQTSCCWDCRPGDHTLEASVIWGSRDDNGGEALGAHLRQSLLKIDPVQRVASREGGGGSPGRQTSHKSDRMLAKVPSDLSTRRAMIDGAISDVRRSAT